MSIGRHKDLQFYEMKYRLAMSHSWSGEIEHKHSHTLELDITAHARNSQFVEFQKMEQILKRVLDKYQQKYLNDFEIFNSDVSIENIGEVFFRELDEAYMDSEWDLYRLRIGETPLRVYEISKMISADVLNVSNF